MPRETIEERRARLMPGARWIRDERERRGWTGTELARRLGIHQTRLSAYERAQDEPPADIARGLAEQFGMTELAVWQALHLPLPRELTQADIDAGISDEQAIAYLRQRWPGALEEILAAAGSTDSAHEPPGNSGRNTRDDITQEGDAGQSASHG